MTQGKRWQHISKRELHDCLMSSSVSSGDRWGSAWLESLAMILLTKASMSLSSLIEFGFGLVMEWIVEAALEVWKEGW